jgi:hypothetical protein
MGYLKTIAAGATIAGALAVTGLGLAAGVANADAPSSHPAVTMSNLDGFALDNWGYGPGYGYGPGDGYGPGYGWAGAPGDYGPGYGYGSGPGYGYGGACAWIPPFVSQWIPPVACGG